jgi:hypothetical protein
MSKPPKPSSKAQPRDALGRYKSSKQPESVASNEPTPQSESAGSSSTLPDTSLSDTSPAPHFVFPKPIRHSIPGSFSPLAESPTETPVPAPSLVSRLTQHFEGLSPSSILIPDSRTPSPIALPESIIPREFPIIPSDSDSDPGSSSTGSSRTISLAPTTSYAKEPSINFRASQFLTSRPDPLPATLLRPTQSSSSSATSTSSQPSSSSSVPSASSSRVSLVSSQSLVAPVSSRLSTSQVSHTSSSALASVSSQLPPVALTSSQPSVPPLRLQILSSTTPAVPSSSSNPQTTQTAPTVPSATVAPVTPAPPPPPVAPAAPPVAPAVVPPPPVPPVPPVIVPAPMAAPLGPAGMPSARDTKAPKFSGEVDESLDEFLREYEDLATGCTLTDRQKVETILRYVPEDLRNLWKILGGFSTHDWNAFRGSLEHLYQGTAANALYTKQRLYDFVASSNTKRIGDIRDVHQYFRKFHIYSQHLVEDSRITTEERDTAFWYGFHPDDREKLSSRLFAKLPDQVLDRPFGMDDVFKTACIIFANRPFLPIELQERQKAASQPKTEPPPWYDQADRNPRVSDHEGRYRQREYDYQYKDPYEREKGRSPDHYYRPRASSPPRAHEYSHRAREPSPPRQRAPEYSYQDRPRKRESSPDHHYHARPPSPPRARDRSPPRVRDRSPPGLVFLHLLATTVLLSRLGQSALKSPPLGRKKTGS